MSLEDKNYVHARTNVTDGFRRTKGGYRQRWRLRIPNSSRRMIKFNNKAQKSRRRSLKSAVNKESYKH